MFDGSLTMSFQALNCPAHVVGSLKHRTHLRTRCPNLCFLAKSSSSILLQTEEHDNLLDPKNLGSSSFPFGSQTTAPLLSQANTVGIIGGMSAVSTLRFLKKLVQRSANDGEESLPFVVCSDPVLNKELSSLERSSFPYLNSRSPLSPLDQTAIVKNLRQKRDFLEGAGARCIVMPCHISHSWYGEISDESGVPFLHVGECVAKELKEANLKPVGTGSSVRIGVLGSEAILNAGFYQEKLQDQGFEVVLPDKATMEHTIIPAIEALNRKDMEGAGNLLRIALQVLLVRAVNTVILASDDMQNLLPRDDPLLKKCIDPLEALARSTIQWAQSPGNIEQKS
ncbi:hypothetical protein H6P81_004201 [Aristolochia fimbriata]|uniref:Aspartate racemase n=1 Tax=Aristolochia fimbriata TaxID=158543 RepID=A0AAV7FHU9_ARIFI|nr:hypothetical protein H6P81_004201 [Aristolochia fimbriata]